MAFEDYSEYHERNSKVADQKDIQSEWDKFAWRVSMGGDRFGKGSYSKRDRGEQWIHLVEEHGSMLRTILRRAYINSNQTNLGTLLFCVVLSTLGYVLLAVPSIDVFRTILEQTLIDVFTSKGFLSGIGFVVVVLVGLLIWDRRANLKLSNEKHKDDD